MITPAPQTEAELLAACAAIAGLSIATLAKQCSASVPETLLHHKGWVGQLLEQVLGATAKSKAVPDFEAIGVELKTIPLTASHLPKESTFVCTASTPFTSNFEDSTVWKKLRRTLWLPIEAASDIPIGERRVGQAILTSPTVDQAEILAEDWHELTEMLSLGGYAELTAKHGTYLHCRPKAANSRVLRDAVSLNGEAQKIVPRGFYLRTSFTQQVLQQHL
jgi:DNA mismatch repair protein MutH